MQAAGQGDGHPLGTADQVVLSVPDSHSNIAGSRVTSTSRSWKLPSARARISRFWRSIRAAVEPSTEVANQLCQTRVMRSMSCWSERTIRSSHQQ